MTEFKVYSDYRTITDWLVENVGPLTGGANDPLRSYGKGWVAIKVLGIRPQPSYYKVMIEDPTMATLTALKWT